MWESVSALIPAMLERLQVLAMSRVALVMSGIAGGVALLALICQPVRQALVFSYNCFLQPLGKTKNQAERLDRFYEHQAGVYDATRTGLLRGRKTMLKLCAAEMRQLREKEPHRKLVWADIGGGTGWNIEQMDKFFPVAEFDQIYLIDLCEPLLKVARERFKRLGYKNVQALCQNAKDFTLPGLDPEQKVDLFTCSYSISMIPPFYAVLDRINEFLDPKVGVFGVADFYVSSSESTSDQLTLVGGSIMRRCHWLNSWFWRHWFALDHIELHPARRDYLEHKFGTLKCFNGRNNFVIPYLVQIPYYVWLGVSRERDTSNAATAFEVEAGNHVIVPPSFPDVARERLNQSKTNNMSTEGAIERLKGDSSMQWPQSSFHYQKKLWRLPFVDDRFSDMFRTWIYGFTWEDPYVDMEHLDLGPSDSILCITSAGDNALHYAATAKPHRIHAVDMNPCQGHLLELKLASIATLDYATFWSMFGEGKIDNFPDLLDQRISPLLSSHAYQFWKSNNKSFERAFYFRGYSGHALRLAKAAFNLMGAKKDVVAMCTTKDLAEQKRIWDTKVRKTIINETLIRVFLSNPAFLWNALGVPINQFDIFKNEGCSVEQFAVDTLDPIPARSLMSMDNYHYRLCLMGNYSHESCPLYLKEDAFNALKADNAKALDCFRLHTDAIVTVLRGMQDASLTRAILMDHMDWFNPVEDSVPMPSLDAARNEEDKSVADLDREVVELARVICKGGAVFWRSAAKHPWYSQRFEKAGFRVAPIHIRETGKPIDNVNMYASFYKAVRM